jgi:hypothetical protein
MQWGVPQTESAPQQGAPRSQRVCIREAALFTSTPPPALIRRRPVVPHSGHRPDGAALIPSNFSKCRPQAGQSYS